MCLCITLKHTAMDNLASVSRRQSVLLCTPNEKLLRLTTARSGSSNHCADEAAEAAFIIGVKATLVAE